MTEHDQTANPTSHNPKVSTLGYGDTVIYAIGEHFVTAQVLQSQLVPTPDRNATGGMRNEEQLTLVYLKPNAGKGVMSSMDIDNAIAKAIGVPERSESNTNGWIRCRKTEPLPGAYFTQDEINRNSGRTQHKEESQFTAG